MIQVRLVEMWQPRPEVRLLAKHALCESFICQFDARPQSTACGSSGIQHIRRRFVRYSVSRPKRVLWFRPSVLLVGRSRHSPNANERQGQMMIMVAIPMYTREKHKQGAEGSVAGRAIGSCI
eukprot:scaffold111215_cov17-Prasinocladus_malaysianus.AAC.1